MSTSTAPALVEPQPAAFWKKVGIFPDALTQCDKREETERRLRRSLQQLGVGNLRLLCERAKLPKPEEADPARLTNTLLAASPENTLLHLREFLHGRVPAVEETFDTFFGESERVSLKGDLEQLGRGAEQMKVFTKLILLYRQEPTRLLDVHFLKLSRARPTVFAYRTAGPMPPDTAERVRMNAEKLEYALHKAIAGRSFRFQGCHELRGGIVVLSLVREFTPKIVPDFRTEYNLLYACGPIVCTMRPKQGRVDMRCRNAQIAESTAEWLGGLFGMKFRRQSAEPFSDYEADGVVNALLGGYDAAEGLEVIAAKFRTSGLPQQSTLIVERSLHQPSVRADLAALRELGALSIRALLEVEQLTLSFRGRTGKVTVEGTRGGAVRLGFDNSEWEACDEDDFRAAFQKTFGLPLDTFIDPRKFAAGDEGIIGYLLTAKLMDQVQPYQRAALKALVDQRVLLTRPSTLHLCRNPACPKVKADQTGRQECAHCGRPLRTATVTRLSRDVNALKEAATRVFDRAGWQLGDKEGQFEGSKFYPLRPKGCPAGSPWTVAVLIRDSVSDGLRAKLERASRPLLILRNRTEGRPAYLASTGAGEMSLAHILAATRAGSEEACAKECMALLTDLMRDNERRVAQAGMRSYQGLRDKLGKIQDFEFETDVYNVLRSLFPNTIKLGRQGKPEPDGFCALPWYNDGSLRDGRLWTWTYDAKLAETIKPYDLGRDEARKMAEYINRFRRSKTLFASSKRLMAHVLVSNNITDGQVAKAHEFLMGEEGLKKANRDVRLVLMRLPFLLRLYELAKDREAKLQCRWPLFAEEFIECVTSASAGPVMIDAPEAERIIDNLIECDPVHPTVAEAEILRALSSGR